MAEDGESKMIPPVSASPPRRVVLLGASNLTRGISTIVDTARRVWGGPLEVLTALGHGRSYGLTSTVLGRRLPGILQCGLWKALADLPLATTTALVTDVGNDILYGAPVESILGWVEECVERLKATGAPVVLTLPPTASVTALTQWRYTFIRSCVFPGCRLSRNDAFSQAEQLDAGLEELATRRGLHVVRPRTEWYGFDPIHIRRRHWANAWNEILSACCAELCADPREPNLARGSFARWLYLQSRAPAQRTIFGVERRAAQPCGRLRDGTTIAIY